MLQAKLELAIYLCTRLYEELSPRLIFPALTGGTLYKAGERKDIDLVIYRTQDTTTGKMLKLDDIRSELLRVGLYNFKNFGTVIKCKFGETDIDLLLNEMEDDYGKHISNSDFKLPKTVLTSSTGLFPCQPTATKK